jgi:hypothetical protein
MLNTAPKFKKIVLLIKSDTPSDDIISNVRITHEDCAMVITGDYVIITEDFSGDNIDDEHSVVGKIYKLNEIDSYKLYKN